MDQLTVVDSDFKMELCQHSKKNKQHGKYFTLYALKFEPYAVYKTHLAYLHAGARVIRTNTIRAVSDIEAMIYFKLNVSEYETLMHNAVKLAKQAVAKYAEEMGYDINSEKYKHSRPLIAGSCGGYLSTHNPLIYSLSLVNKTREQFINFHESHIQNLLTANVDLLAFESISSMEEAMAILHILKRYPEARAWISLLCLLDGKLLDGHEFGEVATMCHNFLPQQIIAIGAECAKPEIVIPFMQIVSEFRDPKIPFLLYAMKHNICTTEIIDEFSIALPLDDVKEWFQRGVSYIGGGAATDAEDIKQICKHIENSRMSSEQASTSSKPCSYRNNENPSKL